MSAPERSKRAASEDTPAAAVSAARRPSPRVGPPIRVLLVEDEPADAEEVHRVFGAANVFNPIDVVRDGASALRFLRREGEYADAPRPGLVLLDLDLPDMDGQDVLAAIREAPDTADLEVVVLTNVVEDAAILRCYDLGIRAFMAKPLEPQNVYDYFANAEDVAIVVCERRR